MRPLYNIAWALGAPAARWWLRHSPGRAPLAARFAPPEADMALQGALWVQACSVGEVNTALPLLDALRDQFPAIPLLLSASTIAGHEMAQRKAGNATHVAWFPFDRRATVRAMLRAVRPRALILVETELWPNAIMETRDAGVPVAIVNGRISDKHWPRYMRYRRYLRPMLEALAGVGVQDARHAERFRAIGVPAERIHVTGNLKFDAVAATVEKRTRDRLRAELGLPHGAPVLVFGSTRPGDEALASACWATLREEIPNLRLIIAPRHVQRAGEILPLFSEPTLRRSEGRASNGERVILLDTLGELGTCYALATAAVIGGSFFPGVDGHNPLEPAALGTPVFFGPYMNNFLEAAGALCAARGATQVRCAEDLYGALSPLLADQAEQRQMGTRARAVVLDNQGAAARNAALIATLLA